jgi:hypothetical protein
MSYVHKHGMPTPEAAAAKYEHGTRARYFLGKCKCFKCKLANSEYEAARAEAKRPPWHVQHVTPRVDAKREHDQDGNLLCRFCATARKPRGITRHENACSLNAGRGVKPGFVVVHRGTGEQRGATYTTEAEARVERDRLNKRDRPKPPTEYVSAAKGRAHLKRLQKQGVGVKSVHAACGVAASVLDRMIRGMIKRTRRGTEAKILGVDVGAARGTAKIDGKATWELLDKLIGSGLYTKAWIARQLGSNTPALQMRNRASVRADKAAAVRGLYDRLWATDSRLREYVDPAAERERREAAAAEAATRTSREKLARALSGWDADEFATRFSRLGDVR